MTPEEIDELAEALEAACDASWTRVSAGIAVCRCPFGALLGPSHRRPAAWLVESQLRTGDCPTPSVMEIDRFMCAFDTGRAGAGDQFWALGLMFREMYP